ncbi:hypothetical protein EDD18DRAFT_1366686 [Armillaria luteobubalina]|uniref:Uncharacterized protein n=1 Tax=Armillaria luteobubalina TaxID=153913 RepID=A0AA39P1Q8_9AGAR|nr:hypothetical protein EDD18DRAFT_1366686 [Armillaria luteobubalina]
MSQFSRPDFILYHITPHLYNPKKLPAKALKKLDLPTKRKKFFHRTMSSPSSSQGSHTAFSGSGPSSPEYLSGSDMNIDSPPAALCAVIAPPGPSGGPSTPSQSQRSVLSVALQFAPQEGSPPPRPTMQLISFPPCPLAKIMALPPALALAPAPTPILPPNPAAGPAPHISSIAMNLIVDGIIMGVVKGLVPFFDHLTAILLQIQQEAAEARQEEKARQEAKEKAREAERQ